jgi:hypothetical protein
MDTYCSLYADVDILSFIIIIIIMFATVCFDILSDRRPEGWF